MAHLGNIAVCVVAMAATWTLMGLPIALRLAVGPHRWLFAPALGWAVHSALSLPIFELAGMSRLNVLATGVLCIAAAVLALLKTPSAARPPIAIVIVIAILAAAILALAPMAGIVPKATPEGITLASPIFDHSKIAMIDEMVRTGVPAQNPYFGEAGTPDRVAYYYLWHFSAAVAAVATSISGWEADAALTGFTAFASLLTMIGLGSATGGKPVTGLIVIALAATASLRTALEWFWPDAPTVIGYTSGFGGWLQQTSWAPQHMASAMCCVIACTLIPTLERRQGWLASAVLGLVGAAAFQSSVWVGGIVFASAATVVGLYCLRMAPSGQRLPFALRAAAAAAIAVALSVPFIHDQIAAAAMRGPQTLLALRPVEALGTAFPVGMRRVLDVPAYWLIYLPVEFLAFFPASMFALYLLLRKSETDSRQLVRVLALLAATSLIVAWLLASVIGDNNDLGWRAVLPAVLILIPLAAGLISQWPATGARAAALFAAAGVLLSLPETVGYIGENIAGLRKPSERIFSATPSMWQAVRRHTSPTERVANNPRFLSDMTPWPVNISWALMGDRRSCYAGNELAIPFAPIPPARRAQIEAQFIRIFAGEPQPGDIEQLAERFRCDTVVVTAQDGAWQRDPFAANGPYRLMESKPDAWRIYRRTARQP